MTKQINEEDPNFNDIKAEWLRRAKACNTPDDLKVFLEELLANEYDYGGIVHACFYAALAGYYVIEHSPQGGITWFQAGCLMWLFVRQFGSFPDGPLQVRDWTKLLYPQYDDMFDRTVPKDVWERLQTLAREKLSEGAEERIPACDDVVNRWRSVAAGVIPAGLRLEGEPGGGVMTQWGHFTKLHWKARLQILWSGQTVVHVRTNTEHDPGKSQLADFLLETEWSFPPEYKGRALETKA